MTCRELLDFLADYLDDQLPEGQRDEFARHLSQCPPCVRYLDTYKATIHAMRSACTEHLNCEEVPEALVKAVLAARAKGANSPGEDRPA